MIFVSLLAVVMILVMVTMLGLKKRCGKAEMYRPVYSGHSQTGDMYQHQPLNISYIDLYSHCNPATGDNHKLMVAANEVSRHQTFCCKLTFYKLLFRLGEILPRTILVD